MSEDKGVEDQLHALLDAQQSRTKLAGEVYAALRTTGKLTSHRVLVYRCSRRCLLLDVLLLPQGLLAAMPHYKLSETMNEAQTSEAGRKENTEDGNRRWKTRAGWATDAVNFTLNCDHQAGSVLSQERLRDDLDSGVAEVIWRGSA